MEIELGEMREKRIFQMGKRMILGVLDELQLLGLFSFLHLPTKSPTKQNPPAKLVPFPHYLSRELPYSCFPSLPFFLVSVVM